MAAHHHADAHAAHDHAHGGHGSGPRHEHGHDHNHDTSLHNGPLGVALVLTAVFMVVEWLAGMLSGSLALMADAGHMLTDSLALALAWSANRIALRPADVRRSFGYQRLRVLATFINGCALLGIVAWIAVTAVRRLFETEAIDSTVMLWTGCAGFLVNLAVLWMLRHGHAHDMNTAAARLHVLSDLFGSAAAVVAALVIMQTGWLPVDALLSLLVSCLIVRSAVALIRRSTHILMEGAPDWLDMGELSRTLQQEIPVILGVHHIHCWLVDPQQILLTMHASVQPGVDHGVVLREINAVLTRHFGITHATIQIETGECVDHEHNCGTGPRAACG
jgi:cobalt-zinc-cadmium efflux system protein